MYVHKASVLHVCICFCRAQLRLFYIEKYHGNVIIIIIIILVVGGGATVTVVFL